MLITIEELRRRFDDDSTGLLLFSALLIGKSFQ